MMDNQLISEIKSIYECRILNPLNQALNGMETEMPITSAYSLNRIRWYHEHNYVQYAEEALAARRHSIEGRIESEREIGMGRVLAEVLMPLYRELLLNPEDRMLDFYHARESKPDISVLRRKDTTLFLRNVFLQERYLSDLFSGSDIIEYMEHCILVEEKKYRQQELFIHAVVASIQDGYTPDWDELYSKIRPELTNIPKNYKRIKVEYCCMIMAVIMIMRNKEITAETRVRLLNQLCDMNVWEILSHLYSILIGAIIRSSFHNHIQIVTLFGDPKKQYAHLLYTCVNYRPSVVKAPDGDYDKQRRYSKAYRKLAEACDKDQCADLDDLFRVIFPDAALKEYSNDTIKLTTAETQKRLEEQTRLIHEQTRLINDQKIEINELRLYREAAEKLTRNYTDDAISIDELKQAIDAIKDPDKAQQFYFQLNYILRKNPAWKKHEDEFADFIDAKMNARERQSNDLISSMKEVASRPTHYHAAGSTYQDKSKQLHIDSSADVNPSKLLK